MRLFNISTLPLLKELNSEYLESSPSAITLVKELKDKMEAFVASIAKIPSTTDLMIIVGICDKDTAVGLRLAGIKDIYIPAMGVMMGNNSYSGQMVGITPAYTSAMVCRNILYPAIIFANPNRDVTTSQMMNFADGGQWQTNDRITTAAYSSRSVKKSFGSHLRTFEGHCLWDAHLQRMNEGASAMYYAGHGTGGSDPRPAGHAVRS